MALLIALLTKTLLLVENLFLPIDDWLITGNWWAESRAATLPPEGPMQISADRPPQLWWSIRACVNPGAVSAWTREWLAGIEASTCNPALARLR